MRFKWLVKNEIAVGGFPYKKDIEWLHQNGIRAIVSLSKEGLSKETIPMDMEYRHFPVEDPDTPDLYLIKEFLLYTDFLKAIRFPFFVHCNDGLIRSPFFATLYFVYQGMPAEKSIKLVSEKVDITFGESISSKVYEFEQNKLMLYPNKEMHSFHLFMELVRVLRRQCPWDREQTHETLIPELIEEPLELVEAIKKKDFEGIKEELGDVSLQVLLHSVIAEEEGKFDISEVLNGIFEKMYRRHPHVFGENRLSESGAVLKQWEEIKKEEKKGKASIGVSKILASLITAFEIQDDARRAGFDFDNVSQILEKIKEETKEVECAINKGENISEELGDLLFSVINLARFLRIDPAHSLFLAVNKFGKRFEYVKKRSPGMLDSMSSREKDKLWKEAKKNI